MNRSSMIGPALSDGRFGRFISNDGLRREGGKRPRGHAADRVKRCDCPGKPMSRYDFRTPRLYVDAALTASATIPLAREQANHLLNVLRLERGDPVLVFNGRDGEWRANVRSGGTSERARA